jgi:hypothetical protein
MRQSPQRTDGELPSKKPARRKFHFRSRIAKLIATAGLFTSWSCQDAVGPEKEATAVPDAPVFGQNSQTALQMLGATLPASTDMFVAAVTDPAAKLALQNYLKILQNDLANNRTAAVKIDVASARAAIATAPAQYSADLGAASVALDQIDLALASK